MIYKKTDEFAFVVTEGDIRETIDALIEFKERLEAQGYRNIRVFEEAGYLGVMADRQENEEEKTERLEKTQLHLNGIKEVIYDLATKNGLKVSFNE